MVAIRLHWTVGALALSLLVAGCASNRPVPIPASTPPPRSTSAISPAAYVATAASASLFIVRASQHIEAGEGYSPLAGVARQLRSDQEGIAAQLSMAGRRLNLLPEARLLPSHQAMLDQLSTSPDASSTYVRQMKIVLPQLLAIHRAYQRDGSSPTLRPVAAMAAPIVAREVLVVGRLR
jgi:putative membrane protein